MGFAFQIIEPDQKNFKCRLIEKSCVQLLPVNDLTLSPVRRYARRHMNGNGNGKKKIAGRVVPRGIILDRGRVVVRVMHKCRWITRTIGKADQPEIINDAITVLNELRQKIRRDKLDIEPALKRITMYQALDLYWKHHGEKLVSKTLPSQIKRLKTFFRDKYIDQITYLDVENFRRSMEKEGYSVSTVNRTHVIITSLFNLLKKWGDYNVIEKIKLPKENPGSQVKKPDERHLARKRVLTKEEFRKLMESSPYELQRVFLGAVHTLLRMSDLQAVTKDNINESTGMLEGIQSKTKKQYSIVITEPVKQLINTAPGHHLFDFTSFEHRFIKAREKSGIPHFEFRDLRRTGARWMLEKGIDISIVSSYLGHSGLQMTQRYVPSTPDHKRKGAEALSKAFEWDLIKSTETG